MKHCPKCNRTFADDSLTFCNYDGEALVAMAAPGGATQATPAPPPSAPTPFAPPASSPPASNTNTPPSAPKRFQGAPLETPAFTTPPTAPPPTAQAPYTPPAAQAPYTPPPAAPVNYNTQQPNMPPPTSGGFAALGNNKTNSLVIGAAVIGGLWWWTNQNKNNPQGGNPGGQRPVIQQPGGGGNPGGGGTQPGGGGNQPNPGGGGGGNQPGNDQMLQQIVQTLQGGVEAQIAAYASGDPTPLQQFYGNGMLDQITNTVQQMKANGMTMQGKVSSLNVDRSSLRVTGNGEAADIKVTTQYELTLMKNGQASGPPLSRTDTTIQSLVNANNRWLIVKEIPAQ